MNYKRFKEIWDCLVTNRIHKKTKPIAQVEISQHTEDALIAYADGDTKHFDKILSQFKNDGDRELGQ
jgi:hypothetical protein